MVQLCSALCSSSWFGTPCTISTSTAAIIVNQDRGKWLWRPQCKLQRSKQRWQDLCWKVHDRALNLLFCAHTIWLNYVTETSLLVSFSDKTQNLLCFVHGQGQKSEQKHGTKNFVGMDFITISLYQLCCHGTVWNYWNHNMPESLKCLVASLLNFRMLILFFYSFLCFVSQFISLSANSPFHG